MAKGPKLTKYWKYRSCAKILKSFEFKRILIIFTGFWNSSSAVKPSRKSLKKEQTSSEAPCRMKIVFVPTFLVRKMHFTINLKKDVMLVIRAIWLAHVSVDIISTNGRAFCVLFFTYVDRCMERSPIGGNHVNRRMGQTYGLSAHNMNTLACSVQEPLLNIWVSEA